MSENNSQTSTNTATPGEHRSGFVAIVGRPNVGKSTLVNAMVGTKIAITSAKPETTRRSIRGIVRRPGLQLVLVDTPGSHRPRTLLGQRLNDLVDEALNDIDCIAVCLPMNQAIGPGDRFLLSRLPTNVQRCAVVTKTDLVSPGQAAQRLSAVAELADWTEIVPVSAVTGFQVELLVNLLGGLMPVGPDYFPDGELSDVDTQTAMAELIREAALADLRNELPHSVAVVIDEVVEQDDNSGLIVRAVIYVERRSQVGIVVGRGGSRLAEIGHQARRQLKYLLNQRVYLDLRVKVAKEWQRDPKLLHRLGF
jgi:GTP-binding protein Era